MVSVALCIVTNFVTMTTSRADLIGDLLDLSTDDNYGSMQPVSDEHNPFMQPPVEEYNPFAMAALPAEPTPSPMGMRLRRAT